MQDHAIAFYVLRLLAASVCAGAAVAVVISLSNWSPGYAPLVFIFATVPIMVIGIPLYLLLRRATRLSVPKAAGAGAAGALLFLLLLTGPLAMLSLEGVFLLGAGAVAGIVFYVVMHGFRWREPTRQ